jgi:hypothetical protein
MSGREMTGKPIFGVEWLGTCFDILYTRLIPLSQVGQYVV